MDKTIMLFGEDNIRYLATLIKNELMKYYDKAGVENAINEAMSSVVNISFEKVEVLPEEGEVKTNVIYMVPAKNSEDGNLYDEYYWDSTSKKFEYFGSSSPNLEDYVKKSDVGNIENTQIQTIWDTVFLAAE